MGALAVAPVLAHCGGESDFDYSTVPTTSNIANLGSLLPPDENGLRLPAGFTSRVIARSEQTVPGTRFVWHILPDGGATFPLPNGDYVYVSNCEALLTVQNGGASAIRFDKNGRIRSAYRILEGTRMNCAGGPTPWGTWMSCEEFPTGLVYECDPLGREAAVAWPMLGAFTHEAIAFDPETMQAYLTEDIDGGRLYRYTPASILPNGRPDLENGTLEALRVVSGELEGGVEWDLVPNPVYTGPSGSVETTRAQTPGATDFNGGEGIWFFDGVVYFTTKGDDRVWALDVAEQELSIVYDAGELVTPVLTGVDNITVTAGGDILVCEDGGDMQVVALTPDGGVHPILQIDGQPTSEVTGIAMDPHRRRIYFSSQRGIPGSGLSGGITHEVEGPFFI